MSQPGKCYRCDGDPCTCGYENARNVLMNATLDATRPEA